MTFPAKEKKLSLESPVFFFKDFFRKTLERRLPLYAMACSLFLEFFDVSRGFVEVNLI